eukprot:scaffold13807_cov78-Skeletonema_dohrnii-CCMP3373.AAC.2
MECDDCDLVRYCSDTCQQDHRPYHELLCKERVAELRDKILFRQPESNHLGDCPICCLPLSIDIMRATMSCCSKTICIGCDHANMIRERENNLQETCPFCRHPSPKTEQEVEMNYMKRVAANDPVAMIKIGSKYYHKEDYESALPYLIKAAELGDAEAHNKLSILYRRGKGVERDKAKEIYHLEEAAIAGHLAARHNLGWDEWENERFERTVKHWIIGANLGSDFSIQALKECYKEGKVSKEGFAAALRARHAAVYATKSPLRKVAAEFYAANQGNFIRIAAPCVKGRLDESV